jgi:hypothetical protein
MRTKIVYVGRMVVLVGLLTLSFARLQAQVDTGSIVGTVTDASGAVVPGATVTLTNVGTNASLSTDTGSDGGYKFAPVRIGGYKIDVSLKGFQTVSQLNVTVDVNSAVEVNFTLKPGSTNEVVTVTSAPPMLQTQNAAVGQVVNRREVDSLPLNGRNFTFLAQLAAGVNTPQADTRNMGATGSFSANGSRPSQNNYLLDGIDNNSDAVDFLNGTNYVVLPPVDAIQEFKVSTSDFSAQYGRSGAAVLNATIKSGTNDLHGTIWEFLRNDKLDAADYFAHTISNGVLTTTKGEQRQNQFGGSAGGPIHRNKIFFFADYEGLRRIQGEAFTATVPTLAERNSGFTNFQDQVSLQSGTKTDALGRTIPVGAIMDPATTRAVTGGSVRDPFGLSSCSNPMVITLATCPQLNMIPSGRLDPNAIKLLDVYPVPNNSGLSNNFTNSPRLLDNRNAFDARVDYEMSAKDQMFFRYSYGNEPEFFPSAYSGTPTANLADGGNFNQTALAQQAAFAETHIFSPNLVNVARVGYSSLHTIRQPPELSDVSNIPGQFGIQGVPQVTVDGSGNGGLPDFTFTDSGTGLTQLGTSTFIPSNEKSDTLQVTDDLTKIWGKHTFQAGMEFQNVLFSTLQPPRSRSEYDFNGTYTNIPGQSNTGNGLAEALLIPIPSTVGGPDDLGGASQARFSNIAVVHDVKQYYGAYVQDDWKMTRKFTLNLGLRWDFFGLVGERDGHQANFVPIGGPTGGPVYILPTGSSALLGTAFISQLANAGAGNGNSIQLLQTNAYGAGLGASQHTNFAPRFGFAYQASSKLVVRGGFGIFYNGFENIGFSPNEGLNYPFIFKLAFSPPNDTTNLTSGAAPFTSACAGPGGSATIETGFNCVATGGNPPSPLTITSAELTGLALEGIQFNYQTPYTMGGNFTLQYALTPTLSIQAGYVTSLARHLAVFPYNNNITQVLPPSATGAQQNAAFPFPNFAETKYGSGQGDFTETAGNSYYHSLQTQIEKQFASGLGFLLAYTYSNVRSDAIDLLNQGSVSSTTYRAPGILPLAADYSQAPFNIRNVFHFSGTYELPFGKGKHFLSNARGAEDAIAGGWSFVWSSSFQGGQPVNVNCASTTAADLGCWAMLIPGMNPYSGAHNSSQFFNPAAFTQPCILGAGGVPTASPAGCVPLTGAAAIGLGPTQLEGPSFDRLDLSTFKEFPIRERYRVQFRCEIFNIANHPNFNAPGFNGGSLSLGSAATFGKIGSTRDNPYDAREIQFALKLYY